MKKDQINSLEFLLSLGDCGEFDEQYQDKSEKHITTKTVITNKQNLDTKTNTVKKIKPANNDYWSKTNILPEEIYTQAANAKTLDELLHVMKSIAKYPLKDNAHNTVFSSGQPNSKIMIIGEAPGAEEDKKGETFVGDSGKLMESLLNKAGFYREKNCYISNIIPWRPPNNQTPTLEEVQTCLPFLIKHISLIKPKLILMVGSVSTKALINDPKIKITQTRGTWFTQDFYGHKTQMLATYHPSFLLRQPQQKKLFWQDLLELKNAANSLQ